LSCDNNFVTVQICDEKGIPCLDSDHWIEFSLIGEGRLHQNLGTATGSSRIQAANGRASIRLDAWGEYAVAAKCYVSGKTLMSIKKKSEQ
jgi:beta-galactosidase